MKTLTVSGSVIWIVPPDDWFSFTEYEVADETIGALSFKSTTLIVISDVVEFTPSKIVTVAVYEVVSS